MKLRSALLFSIVISLAFVAIAGEVKEYELKFKGDGYFDVTPEFDGTGNLVSIVFSPAGGFDLLDVSHLGESKVVWEIRVTPFYTFVDGWFTITGANASDSLEGHYDSFQLGVGTYALDWVFTDGTGRFEGATGTGHTDGLVDFGPPPYAQFEFSGMVTAQKK